MTVDGTRYLAPRGPGCGDVGVEADVKLPGSPACGFGASNRWCHRSGMAHVDIGDSAAAEKASPLTGEASPRALPPAVSSQDPAQRGAAIAAGIVAMLEPSFDDFRGALASYLCDYEVLKRTKLDYPYRSPARKQ